MTRIISSTAQAQALVGVPLGPSEAVIVDQGRIDKFADATGGHQWIHVYPESAADGPFGATIAHGYLTLSLVPMLAAQVYSRRFGQARLNYGVNKVRFPSPVKMGSALRATATITEVRTAPQGTFLTAQVELTADGADRPACVAQTIALVGGEAGPAPAAGDDAAPAVASSNNTQER
jgi:acyl dehydratase